MSNKFVPVRGYSVSLYYILEITLSWHTIACEQAPETPPPSEKKKKWEACSQAIGIRMVDYSQQTHPQSHLRLIEGHWELSNMVRLTAIRNFYSEVSVLLYQPSKSFDLKSRSMSVETVKCEGNQCLLFDYYEKIETSIEKVSHLKCSYRLSYRRSRAAYPVLWLSTSFLCRAKIGCGLV